MTPPPQTPPVSILLMNYMLFDLCMGKDIFKYQYESYFTCKCKTLLPTNPDVFLSCHSILWIHDSDINKSNDYLCLSIYLSIYLSKLSDCSLIHLVYQSADRHITVALRLFCLIFSLVISQVLEIPAIRTKQGCNSWLQIGSGWFQMGQIWDF